MNKNRPWNWRAMRDKGAFLALADGSVFRGYSVGADKDGLGEVVFNTGMTGYQEILTDPSYSGQIVTMTYPEIGNTGINQADMEARRPFLGGFVVHEIKEPCNWRSELSLRQFLCDHGLPAIAGVDTRALTLTLRNAGTLKGVLAVEGKLSETEAIERARQWSGLDGQDHAALVTIPKAFQWDPDGELSRSWGIAESLPTPDIKLVSYDFGIKWNILRRLREQGMDIRVVPAKTTAEDILALKPDGMFLSNGPADPAAIGYAIENIARLIGKIPIMGICLGHQLVGLALGGKTYRLKFGHHGCNHPVKDLATGSVEITSQNHNFAVDTDSLPGDVDVTHVNLNDGTVEGLTCEDRRLFTVQYHPEAAPGPHDSRYLFKRFRDLLKAAGRSD